MDNLIFINGTVITPFEKLSNKALFLKNGRIEKIINIEEFKNYKEDYIKNYKVIDIKDNYISPGFIDIHTHGAGGADVVKDSIEPIAKFIVKHGTTSFLPTLMTTEFNSMIDACSKISNFMKKKGRGSIVLGINSEGPYLNPDFGAQKKDLVKVPRYKDYSKLLKASSGNLKIMTVAPELEGSADLIKYLRQNDVVVSIGHTNIKLAELHKMLKLGITLITHIFDAMGEPVSKRKGLKTVGIQEELLICDDIMSEVICDRNGVHVKPTWLKILIRCKGIENIILITDSMNITGSQPGQYFLQDGRQIILKKGEDIARLGDGESAGGICGSVITMNSTIRNIIEHTKISLKDAVRMATYNPAKAINISNRKGIIKENMDADIVVFDKNVNIKMTIVDGEIRFRSG